MKEEIFQQNLLIKYEPQNYVSMTTLMGSYPQKDYFTTANLFVIILLCLS